MDPIRALLEVWPRELAQVLGLRMGSEPQIETGTARGSASLWWETRFHSDPAIILAVGAHEETWLRIGSMILRAAGIAQIEQSEARSTWLELLDQAAANTARALETPLGRAVDAGEGCEIAPPAEQIRGVLFELDGERTELLLAVRTESPTRPAAEPDRSAPLAGRARLPSAAFQLPRPMDALLDMQLPVSISFGQARIPLKDVLRLTAGSVVELNRLPEDPVDVIVNDCVIARGEVVVVDGNYAVRIHSILGRRERLDLQPGRSGQGGNV